MQTHPPLTPYSLDLLLGRVAAEWESRHRIFDLPTGRFFAPDPSQDLSVEVAGRRVATPAGPAAGPHTQLAQNLVLGWLAGARTFELKTVQILDELEIGRPCIDMETIGYNIEWSQELTLDQSLEEYVKAWMMLEILSGWEPIRPLLGHSGEYLFDMSVGYDLAGISSPRVGAFIEGLQAAGPVIDGLRDRIPEPFAAYRGYPYPERIVTSATLSTFHGCPPDEIESITRFLIDEFNLDVTVKLNPTLLGLERVREIVHDRLGYHEVRLKPDAFEEDLAFDRALELIRSLAGYAADRGKRFGVKLTNTLVVENHRGVLPDDPMYLSGPPLHVLAIVLLDELVGAMPDTFRLGRRRDGVAVSFSAGIDRANFASAAGLGMAPITVCSDLLQAGGYGRLSTMMKKLSSEMHGAGCPDMQTWVEHLDDRAVRAGHRDAVAEYAAHLLSDGAPPYGHEANSRPPRTVDHTLEMWGCVSCNLCITVCPNDAMLHLATPESVADRLPDKWQYFCLVELCNECGNCTTFCPEHGAPFAIKPRLYLEESRFVLEEHQGFLLRPADGGWAAVPKDGWESEREPLETLLNAEEGLPLRPVDLGAP